MILLVNDDGIDAPGLRALYRALRERTGEPVLAVAPDQERSGQSQAITLDRALLVASRLEPGFFGFAVDGTPTDCVKLALTRLCPEPPLLVVSGINRGPNVGRSIHYSGTLGAALEAAVEGFAALAVSQDKGAEHPEDAADLAAGWAVRLLAQVRSGDRFRGLVVNLNCPATPAKAWMPLRSARHGRSGFRESYRPQRLATGHGWKLVGDWAAEPSSAPDADDAALLSAGHPVVSLLHPDLNHDGALLAEVMP